jgi:tetratricopeptide (TPR) repeat protein
MGTKNFVSGLLQGFLVLLLFFVAAQAQAPPSIQIFMPDGSLPPREVRFTLTSEEGLVETFFTDSKGRFLITRKEGLKPDAGYTVTIVGDGRTYATTSQSFKLYGVYYIPIFLRPLEEARPNPAKVIDVAEFDDQAPEEARKAFASANRAISEGNLNEAVERFGHAINIYPKYFRALNDLGVLFIRMNRIDEAAKTFEKAIALAPHIYYPRLNLGIVKTRQGKYKDAIEILDKLFKEQPTLMQVRVALADALQADNRLDEAEVHLRAALANKKWNDVREGNVYYQLGLLHNRQRKYAEAKAELSNALKTLPNASRVHLQLGAALLELNELNEAENELKTAYRLGGAELGGAQLLLGQAYFAQKKYDLARQAFEQYLIDVPKAPNRTEVQGVIEKIKAAMTQKSSQ